MSKNSRTIGSVVVLCLFCCSWVGCNQSGLSGLVRVEGIVYYEEKPLSEATVTFTPTSAAGRTAFGITDTQGKFRLWTLNPKDGAFPGEYAVTITKNTLLNPMTREQLIAFAEKHGYDPPIEARNDIPLRYADAKSSGLTVSVPDRGTRDIEFKLSEK